MVVTNTRGSNVLTSRARPVFFRARHRHNSGLVASNTANAVDKNQRFATPRTRRVGRPRPTPPQNARARLELIFLGLFRVGIHAVTVATIPGTKRVGAACRFAREFVAVKVTAAALVMPKALVKGDAAVLVAVHGRAVATTRVVDRAEGAKRIGLAVGQVAGTGHGAAARVATLARNVPLAQAAMCIARGPVVVVIFTGRVTTSRRFVPHALVGAPGFAGRFFAVVLVTVVTTASDGMRKIAPTQNTNHSTSLN